MSDTIRNRESAVAIMSGTTTKHSERRLGTIFVETDLMINGTGGLRVVRINSGRTNRRRGPRGNSRHPTRGRHKLYHVITGEIL